MFVVLKKDYPKAVMDQNMYNKSISFKVLFKKVIF